MIILLILVMLVLSSVCVAMITPDAHIVANVVYGSFAVNFIFVGAILLHVLANQ